MTTAVPQHLTDEALREKLTSRFRGVVVEAEYLLEVEADDRALVVANAGIYANRQAGDRYSDGLWFEVRRYLGDPDRYRAMGKHYAH
jgi:hypothetical protein